MPHAAASGPALVLGGAGLLGQALVRRLRGLGRSVLAPAHTELDATDEGALRAYVAAHAPAILYNAIAYTAVDAAESDEKRAETLNVRLPQSLGRIARDTGLPLIHFSTDFVFDGSLDRPYAEEDATRPLSVYGRTKRDGEEALQSADPPRYCIVRTAWLFGHGRKNFVATILERCRTHGGANVVADQKGSPTYAEDLARYSILLSESGASGVFHIVNSGRATWHELAVAAARITGCECPIRAITHEEYPTPAVRPASSVLDTSRFTAVTGIRPRPWQDALRDFLQGPSPQASGPSSLE